MQIATREVTKLAWELWQDKASFYPDADDKHTTYRVGFFCNTTDTSFGPVCYFEVSMGFDDAVEEIFKKWDAVDPRSMSNTAIADELERIQNTDEVNWRYL